MLSRMRRMGIGAGIDVSGGKQFVPDDLLSGATGLFADLDAAGAVTRNTQPDTSGGWAGASWAGSGLGPYTHTPGDATALAAAIAIVGNRYLTRFTVTDRTAGSVTFYAGTTAGTARSTNATFTEDLTCAANTSHSFVPSADFDGKVTVDSVVVVANLSVSQVTCKGNLGNLVQATAANMPWDSDASAPTSVLVNGRHVLYFDGVEDHMTSDLAASAHPYHKAAGFTASTLFNVTAKAYYYHCLLATFSGAAATHGVSVFVNDLNQNIVVQVANGSGTFVINNATPNGSATNGSSHILTMSWSEAGGLRVLVDGNAAVTAASVGAASASDALTTLQVGRRVSGVYTLGKIAAPFIRVGAVSEAELLQLHKYMRSYYAL